MTWAFLVDSVPFTLPVIAGETSLGGSESAALGLARALARRGHGVHLFTTQLATEAVGHQDQAGVIWHSLDEFTTINTFLEFDVVVALRMLGAFAGHPIQARLKLLWSQDLLVPGAMQQSVMSIAWALDHICYVSDYHRRQWEHLQPEVAGLGWVTKNGYDPTLVPADVTKDPARIIHSSRPERGLGPLLLMWPALKAACPDATLDLCRYSSMYDQGPGSWSDVCAQWDARVAEVQAKVGGIRWLGELTKPQLYQAISTAAVMWYPGVSTFAETSCLAAVEAQACGTPFVGSYRGALSETCPDGMLIRGDHASETYQAESQAAVLALLDGCARNSFEYRRRQQAGRRHVLAYTHEQIAVEWERQVETWFAERYTSHTAAVQRQLLHEDDHVAAKQVAEARGDHKAREFCDFVIAGKDHTAEDYGAHAIADPLVEADGSGRFQAVARYFEHTTHLLDIACGNGSAAIAFTRRYPMLRIHGLDFSAANILRAREGAARAGVGERCTFEQVTVYDFDRQALSDEWQTWRQDRVGTFDGLFVGEFLEHVANATDLIDGLEVVLRDGAQVAYTCPRGPLVDMVPRDVPLHRGHVHHFQHDDLHAVFGQKRDLRVDYIDGGLTPRGQAVGNWLIRYTHEAGRRARPRPLAQRIARTRPYQRLSVGILAKNAETTIGRCLESVWAIADEIVIGDTGSTDTTKAIAAQYGAIVLDLDPIDQQPEGFAGARNAVLARCTGDWFLWIDTDEALIRPYQLRHYLNGSVYHGFILHQTHLYIDGPPTYDKPVRLFRNTGHVRFYGCVHEQPQDGHANGDIMPVLELWDVCIAHMGYLTADGREQKRLERNLPLLLKDGTVFQERTLGKVLQCREAVIQADLYRARGDQSRAQQGYQWAVYLFVTHFDDPAHKYHGLARPWYEAALQHLGIGWEHEIALAGKYGGLGPSHAAPERVWVRDAAEYARLVTFKVKGLAEKMAPVTFVTDPDALVQVPIEPALEATA